MALGVDNSWSQEEFEARFSVEGMQWAVLPRPQDGRQDRGAIQFDLLNVDPAIANAFRRILISDLPTMAIEHVFIVDNTSVMTVRRAAASLSWQAGVLPCGGGLGLANVVAAQCLGPLHWRTAAALAHNRPRTLSRGAVRGAGAPPGPCSAAAGPGALPRQGWCARRRCAYRRASTAELAGVGKQGRAALLPIGQA